MFTGGYSDLSQLEPLLFVPSRVAWDLGGLLAEELAMRGIEVQVVCPPDLVTTVEANGFKVAPRFRRTFRVSLASRMNRVLVRILFDQTFSESWARQRRAEVEDRALPRSERWLTRFPIKVRLTEPQRNRLVHRVTSLVLGRGRERLAIVISPTWNPTLLCFKGTRIVTVVESWDHYMKFPAGYMSDFVISWNQDLLDQWLLKQGGRVGLIGFPHKLGYLRNRAVKHIVESVDCLMYAFTLRYGSYGFDEEIELLRNLNEHLSTLGIEFVVKPKPSETPTGRALIEEVVGPHRVLGVLGGEHGADFSLTPEYNMTRLRQLLGCQAVLSWGTTFALDAAFAGVPVIQLDLRESTEWPKLGSLSRNDHLSRFLLSREGFVTQILGAEDLESLVKNLSSTAFEKGMAMSTHLNSWLAPNRGQAEALKEFGDLIVSITDPSIS